MKAELPSLQTVDLVCHELRKPVAVILAYAELLVDEIAGPLNDKQKTQLETVLKNVQRLDRLIGDLFETFRIVSDSAPPRREQQDLERLCHDLAAQFEASCRERGVRFTVRTPGEVVHAGLDAGRLRSALTRLIENLLRFAGEKEPLVLSLARHDGLARFELRDPGPPLSQEETERIFDLFYRPERDLQAAGPQDGAGLGVCRVLVESLGGRIWAENQPGQAPTFILELPLGETASLRAGSHGLPSVNRG